jgi:hypothetical protein
MAWYAYFCRQTVRLLTACAMVAFFLMSMPLPGQRSSTAPDREWMKKVRIGAYSLTSENAEQIVQQAEVSGVYGIEVDNDIPGVMKAC